jgi:hypothetical protein
MGLSVPSVLPPYFVRRRLAAGPEHNAPTDDITRVYSRIILLLLQALLSVRSKRHAV